MYAFLLIVAALAVFTGLTMMFGIVPVALVAVGLALAAYVTRHEWATRH